MRTLAPVVFLAACGSSLVVACGASAPQFAGESLPAGTALVAVQTLAVETTTDGPLGPSTMRSTADTELTARLLEVNGNDPVRWEMAFGKASVTKSKAGQERSLDEPFSGRTYKVRWADPAADPTVEEANPATVETRLVIEKAKALARHQRFAALLPREGLVAGQPLNVPREALSELLARPDATVDEIGLVFTRTEPVDDRAAAWFDLDLKMSGMKTGPEGAMTMALDGELALDLATGRPVRIQMAGPVTMTGNPSGTGKLEMDQRVSIRPPHDL